MPCAARGAGAAVHAAGADPDLRRRPRPAGRPGELANGRVPARQRACSRSARSSRTPRATPGTARTSAWSTRARSQDHIREHGSYDNNYTVGDRFFAVVAQGVGTPSDHRADRGLLNPAFNDSHGTHVSGTIAASRDGRRRAHAADRSDREHARRRVQRRPVLRQHGQDRRRALRQVPDQRHGSRRRPTTRYIGNVYRAVKPPDRERQTDPADHLELGQRADHRALRLPRAAAPAEPVDLRPQRRWRYLTLPEGVADADGNTSHWANGAMEVARAGTLIQITAGNNGFANPTARASAAVLPTRPRAQVVHDLGHQPGHRAHAQPGRVGARAGHARRSTAAASRSGRA